MTITDITEGDELTILVAQENRRRSLNEKRMQYAAHMIGLPGFDKCLKAEEDAIKGTKATQQSYRTDFGIYQKWADQNGIQRFPSHPEMLATFLLEQAATGKSMSRLKRMLASVKWANRMNGSPFDDDDVVLRATMRWIELRQDEQKQKDKEIN